MVLLQHVSPEDMLRQKRLYLADCQERLQRMMERQLTETKHIDSVSRLTKGQHLMLTFADGKAKVTVDEITGQKNGG